jgi:hypothetical protein
MVIALRGAEETSRLTCVNLSVNVISMPLSIMRGRVRKASTGLREQYCSRAQTGFWMVDSGTYRLLDNNLFLQNSK